MARRRRADASPVGDWAYSTAERLQAQAHRPVPAGTLLLALAIGLLVAPLSALAHEYGHALAARRCGLVGVALPRLDRGRFTWRLGFGLSRVLSARDGRGWVRLHPAVPRRQAVAILVAGPAAELALAVGLLAVALAVDVPATIRAMLAFGAFDCLAGAVATLVRREGGSGDGAQLRLRLAQDARRPRPAAPARTPDPHEATSFAPPG
jgi:hypothetical protein